MSTPVTMEPLLPLLAGLPWLGAALMACLPAGARKPAAWLAAGVAALGLAMVMMLAPPVFSAQVPMWSVPWIPSLGLDLHFRADGLAWLFALLITGIGLLVVIYAAWYLDPEEPSPRFFTFLLMFMGAMLGIVLSGNLLLLVLFWELTSLSSFLLIGWWHRRDEAREGARMALAITGAGGLCLLAGVLLLGHIVGSFSLDAVLAAGDTIRAHALYETALVLVLLGAFTKSAQFPFHFWLPHAMAAPTPVSAYLHSATMVKAGVFLLARLYPALGSSEPWFWIVSSAGLITLLVGAYIAIFKHDLKGLLAYSTVSHLGLITLLFGLDSPLAVVAGVFHIMNHATFKAGLFMSAGIIDHECGTRDMRRLGGLMKLMPFTATLGMVAAAAMAGVPLMNGFLSKEMFFTEAVARNAPGLMAWLLPVGATVAGVLGMAYSLRFVHDVFFNGSPKAVEGTPHEPPLFMRLPVLVLVVLCLLVGLAPQWAAGPTLAVAAQAALYGGPGTALPAYKLSLWHGFNLPLLMSVIAVVGGIALYFGLQKFVNLHRLDRLPLWVRGGGREAFGELLDAGLALARAVTARLQSGRLQHYLLALVVMALLAGTLPFLQDLPAVHAAPLHLDGLSPGVAAVGLIGIAMALATTLFYRQRLVALLLMGAVGLVVCLAFAWFSAPDLALTQLLVEVVTIVLMMLALHWLPAESPPLRRRGLAVLHGVLAVGCGLGTAALTWWVIAAPFDSISPFFLERTIVEGGGANAVNVILVDFRGFDTMGEITVLGIAAVTIHALLSRFTPPPGSALLAPVASMAPGTMLQLVSRLVMPFAVLITIYLYLRGHNLPGGGFIAGLVLSIALILQHVAHGQGWARARLGGDYRGWIGWGLLIAGGTGVGAWFFGAPFLTSTYDYPMWPLVGDVPLASAALFDLGVFLTVVGATMVALLAIARLSTSIGPSGARP